MNAQANIAALDRTEPQLIDYEIIYRAVDDFMVLIDFQESVQASGTQTATALLDEPEEISLHFEGGLVLRLVDFPAASIDVIRQRGFVRIGESDASGRFMRGYHAGVMRLPPPTWPAKLNTHTGI